MEWPSGQKEPIGGRVEEDLFCLTFVCCERNWFFRVMDTLAQTAKCNFLRQDITGACRENKSINIMPITLRDRQIVIFCHCMSGLELCRASVCLSAFVCVPWSFFWCRQEHGLTFFYFFTLFRHRPSFSAMSVLKGLSPSPSPLFGRVCSNRFMWRNFLTK